MENNFEPLVEASRVSINERIIFTDKTPKSLFEYFINGYTEKDIQVLINNLRMDFDVWDKTCNFYKNSNTIAQLSSDDISVLYSDDQNNSFIYSFATKKIYFYDEANAPYIDLNQGMSILDFLLFAKRDFEALLRTPYGKKYVTESAVITEGIREFFGYGTALRIFIDQRGKNDNTRRIFDEHTYACIDALIQYQNSIISNSDYRNILGRRTTLLQIFNNSELGGRDLIRSMYATVPPKDQYITSFGEILKKYDQSPIEIFYSYQLAKSLQLSIAKSKELLNPWFNKNLAIKKSLIEDVDDEFVRNVGIYACTIHLNYINIFDIDSGIFCREYINNLNNRFQKLKDFDIHQKFLSYIDQIINIMNSTDKTKTWVYRAKFDISEEEARSNKYGICSIVAYPYSRRNIVNRFIYKLDKKERSSFSKDFIDNRLFTYFMGRDVETFRQDLLREAFDIPHTEDDNVDIEINLDDFLFDENDDPVDFDPYMENTMRVIFEADNDNDNRSTGRKIVHAIKDGVNTVTKTASNIGRFTKDLTDPVGKKFREFVDGWKKDSEETEREIAITGSNFLKMRQFLKSYVLPAVIIKGLVSPWTFYLGALGFIIKKAVSDKDNGARDKVIRELEVELKMVREKIDDAKSDNDRKAKYQLMRMESQLENEISRIKYNSN